MSVGIQFAEVTDGRLTFDGVDLLDLAQRLPTPFYLYSARRVRWNIESVRNAFTRRHIDTDVFYASKACSLMWFLRQVLASGADVEVNSGGELWKALQAGFRPDQIVVNGVAKTIDELREGVQVGVRAFIVDSLSELERLAGVAAAEQLPAALAVRADVDVPAQTHPGLVTARGGKFGLDRDDVVEAFRFAAAHEWLEPRGLHVHLGSQITTLEPYARGLETALDLLADVEAACDLRLEYLDAGGGFPVAYKPPVGAKAADATDYFRAPHGIDDYAETVCGVLERRRPDLRLFVEPGRSIAATAAILVTRVEAEKKKAVRDRAGAKVGEDQWLMLDAGYETLLEHRLYEWYFPHVVASRMGVDETARYRLAGPLCDSGDVYVGDDHRGFRELPVGTTVGDVVVFGQVGAYALEMMTPAMARPRAAAFAVEGGVVRRIRRRDSLQDLVAGDEGWQPARGS